MAPLHTVHLLPLLDEKLLALLRSLHPEDWERPTLAPGWRVRDVALHLLDGNLRTLSMLRDGYFGQAPASGSYADVVSFLNKLNADWVAAGQRLSPAVITWLLALSGPEYQQYLASLDPEAPAVFSVAWAGEEQSANWFHIAREYTEKWHHQQQIRQAVGQEAALFTAELYYPFLDTCLRALPHQYRNTEAVAGTTLLISITGEGGGHWLLRRLPAGWQLEAPVTTQMPTTHITLAGAVAWRLFTKSLPRPQAEQHVHTSGEARLAEPLFSMLTVMA
ncbi:maleylpyruvate isomerase N-terminal domain-containing protein [Hymenobacter sp. DG25B]|uniref:maleylpyruvate isomerase N-terminal domain-containing protein n=1 Tax=Hymenobacter sp. DG25B TaxID=1385664 RepID=UPI0005CA5EA4|nr:maleylpyruvate isomerase N-terminal domain-containing protein [Hymenobacter sp. DG25B]